MAVRIATYNIHRCIGRDRHQSPERIAAVLQEIDADLIALQEVAFSPGHPENTLAILEEATGTKAIPGFTLLGQHGFYGNALLSRLEISKINHIDISVSYREPRGIIGVELTVNQCKVAVLATHLGLIAGERRRQVTRILSELETTRADAIILLGDFNEWFSLGRPLRWLHQQFKPTRTLATFPAHRPLFGLDRIWIHPEDRLLSLRVHITALSKTASDHLPLVADVDF